MYVHASQPQAFDLKVIESIGGKPLDLAFAASTDEGWVDCYVADESRPPNDKGVHPVKMTEWQKNPNGGSSRTFVTERLRVPFKIVNRQTGDTVAEYRG